MSPDEVRDAKKTLGLASDAQLGRLVGLDGKNADRNVRRYTSGEVAVPGSIERLIRLALARPDILDWLKEEAAGGPL